MKKKYNGFIEVIFGPMFAGKTSELMRRVKTYTAAKKNCLVICSSKDDRYSVDNFIVTHDGLKNAATKVKMLKEVDNLYQDYDVIAIDEGQFFPDLVEKSDQFANEGKIVIIASLDGTYMRKSFGDVSNLLPIAEKITKLKSICMGCGAEASYTAAKHNLSGTEVIGGSDLYIPFCRSCYFNYNVNLERKFMNQELIREINYKLQNKKKSNMVDSDVE